MPSHKWQKWVAKARRAWRTLEHPNGRRGLVLSLMGEDIVMLPSLSPKQATVVVLGIFSIAFWVGIIGGLSLFSWLLRIPAELASRVTHGAYIACFALYASVMFGAIHVVFMRDNTLWSIEGLDL